jgi:hypothetical protein
LQDENLDDKFSRRKEETEGEEEETKDNVTKEKEAKHQEQTETLKDEL